jgi:ABC-type bacteriocin/lantibiotic exporter with double-glycine peptidase domain
MPEGAMDLTGFPLMAGLWRLLGELGHEGGFQAFLDRHALEDPEGLTLDGEGFQARVAALPGADLDYLARPALLELRDGSWLLLLKASRKGFQVATPQGALDLSREALAAAFAGRAVEVTPALGPGSLGRRLGRLVGRHRRHLLHLGLATALLQGLGLAGPIITGVILNRALPDGAGSLLELVAAGILLVALFQAWLTWFRGRVLLYLVNRVEVATERGFMEHLLSLPFPFLQTWPVGELLQAFSGLTTAREFLMEKALGTLLDGTMAILQLGAMAWMLPAPTAVVVMATLLISGATLASGFAQARLQAMAVQGRAREAGLLVEILSGIATVKAAGAERVTHQRWAKAMTQVLTLGLRQGRIHLWTEAGVGFLTQGLAVFLLIWGGRLVLAGTLRLGTLFAFLELATGFMASLLGVVEAALGMAMLRPQLARAEAILAVAPEPAIPASPPPASPGPILMEDVWFRYAPEAPWVLSSFNLRVEAGDKHTLQGISGSGKTTILRLLAGLYTPDRGGITLNGVPPRGARASLLYLPQFLQLMGGTVLENLRLLSGGAPREALLEAAARSGLQELVAGLPMGYDTLLSHGGGNLSGGQRQLLALTAALASGKRLLLLDEAMANLDLARSAMLNRALAEGPWTVIAASHRA